MVTPVKKSFPPPPVSQAPSSNGVQFGKIQKAAGHRIVLYGPGGIGKTTLAANSVRPVAFIDLDDSLSRLLPQLEAAGLDQNIRPVSGIETFKALRDALHAPGWNDIGTIVIDSATKAEELCIADTLANVPHEKGHKVKSIEDYGYGKGYTHVFDTFLPLLSDLDAHARAGRHIILICHDCTTTVPNPAGDDWLRYEPRLQSPASGKASIRLRTREWADHMLFYGYDVDVTKDGKGKGAGCRTIYPSELPHCMAKSRTLRYPLPIQNPGPEVWENVFKGNS
jgi:hypothetical protein